MFQQNWLQVNTTAEKRLREKLTTEKANILSSNTQSFTLIKHDSSAIDNVEHYISENNKGHNTEMTNKLEKTLENKGS